MTGILLTKSTTFIIGPVASLLGVLMNAIFNFLDIVFGIQNISISIIVFTIVIYTLMIPLNYNQQKFQRLSSVMQPEIKKIQDKYKNKKDQVSMQKMQEETKLVYEKYGTSATGGCMQLLIQMPILFGLYKVIQNIPAYVESVKENYLPLANEILNTDGCQSALEVVGSESPIYISPDNYDYTQVNTIVDVLYKFQDDTWAWLASTFPDLDTLVVTTQEGIEHLNSFLGISITNSPMTTITQNYQTDILMAVVAILIPVLAGLSQYLSIKLAQTGQEIDPENPMASSMKTMNTTMPLLSVFMCFTLPAGLGIYWIASAIVRTVQQIVIKKYLARQSLDDLIEKNRAKAAAKREKKGTSASKINEMAQKNAKRVEELQAAQISAKDKETLLQEAKDKRLNAKPGSLSAKANMVKDFNESNRQ
ncbi:MAG: YidC/Oxa1 family membrane protein insertase [Eubacteriales bacterium]